jgi:hypothetical protein
VNPFSSEVLVLSRHSDQEGTLTKAHKSAKLVRRTGARWKRFYLEVSSFFLNLESTVASVQKMSLQSKPYNAILVAPWLSEFFIQTESSFKCRRWDEKFDAAIKCSAIHPTGQYVALGFGDCFKIYFLTLEGLAPTYITQNLKECTSLCYSKAGNDLAAAAAYNILIYDCYSYTKKHQICLGVSYRIEEVRYSEGFDNGRLKHCLECITSNKRLVTYNTDLGYQEEFAFNPKSHLENSVADDIMTIVSNKMNKISNKLDLEVGGEAAAEAESKARLAETSNLSSKKFGAIVYDEKTNVVIFSLGAKIYFIST